MKTVKIVLPKSNVILNITEQTKATLEALGVINSKGRVLKRTKKFVNETK